MYFRYFEGYFNGKCRGTVYCNGQWLNFILNIKPESKIF